MEKTSGTTRKVNELVEFGLRELPKDKLETVTGGVQLPFHKVNNTDVWAVWNSNGESLAL